MRENRFETTSRSGLGSRRFQCDFGAFRWSHLKPTSGRARYERGSSEYFAKFARGSTVFSDHRPIFEDKERPRLVGCTPEYRSTLGRTGASYGRAGNELLDLKNCRRLVADVKNTFRVSASFGRLQKIAGDPENSRDARRNIGRTTAVNVV
ncbi:hypothetical protein Bbelb_347560 [Branchiostoma belcheri]|nr:hypothetical protein Bbelb_347560 [Branchiostoma belcheri]